MSYQKAENILPQEIIEVIQKYIDGSYIYIPRKGSNRKMWGENTLAKKETHLRNQTIYEKYQNGFTVEMLSQEFYLSEKSIYRIIHQAKNCE